MSVYGRGGGRRGGGRESCHAREFSVWLAHGSGCSPSVCVFFFPAFVARVFFSAPTDFSLEQGTDVRWIAPIWSTMGTIEGETER